MILPQVPVLSTARERERDYKRTAKEQRRALREKGRKREREKKQHDIMMLDGTVT